MYDFAYRRPASIDDASELLRGANDPRLLAGGMSLLPTLKQRFGSPDLLVDLAGIGSLRGIQKKGEALLIGAMTTHAEVARSPVVATAAPALAALAGGIGDPQVRNRGTIGGSIANADPAADYPAAVVALDATVSTNRRDIPGAEFFTSLFETALEPDEIVVSVRFPLPRLAAYAKYRQQASRLAIVGVFVAETASGVRVAVTGAAPCVFRWKDAEAALNKRFGAAALDKLILPCAELNSDLHASREYRAHCVNVMARRAVDQALDFHSRSGDAHG
jgi:carbon-monoxide dehydrogenase medium subunit